MLCFRTKQNVYFYNPVHIRNAMWYLAHSYRAPALQFTGRRESDSLHIFSQYKQMNYFMDASLSLDYSGRCWTLGGGLPAQSSY